MTDKPGKFRESIQNVQNRSTDLEKDLEKANKPKMTNIAAKIYQKDKAEFINNSDDLGRTASAQLAILISKFNRGELIMLGAMDHLKDEEYERLKEEIDKVQNLYSELNEHRKLHEY